MRITNPRDIRVKNPRDIRIKNRFDVKRLRYPWKPKEKKAVTIGIGFMCVDGIVVCSDTQITVEGSHTYYSPKIWDHRGTGWSVVFTFAGSVDLMDSFKERFVRFIGDKAITATIELRDATEAVLAKMPSLQKFGGLSMLGALGVASGDLRMIRTMEKVVTPASDYEYVGAGDSSLLRFLADLVCKPGSSHTYAIEQAFNLGTFLIHKAKRYTADSCGGDTEVLILRANGHIEFRSGGTKEVERRVIEIEERLKSASSLSFNASSSDELLDQNWALVVELIKRARTAKSAVQSGQ